jgi:hypothetical protein
MKNFLIVYQLLLQIKFDNYHQQIQIQIIQILDCKIDQNLISFYIYIYIQFSRLNEAKSMVCLEVMQVLIMCPSFYSLIDNSSRFFKKRILLKLFFFKFLRCKFNFKTSIRSITSIWKY